MRCYVYPSEGLRTVSQFWFASTATLSASNSCVIFYEPAKSEPL